MSQSVELDLLGDDAKEQTSPFLVERHGQRFAGVHVLVDMWDAHNLSNVALIEMALIDGAKAAKARILGIETHGYPEGDGVTGIAVLAESHVSIHTWPECGYVAIDLFMCGHAQPHKAIPIFEKAFQPGRMEVKEFMRGQII